MIAISYRREDSTGITGRVYDRLQTEFGKPNVFMDFDSIPYGIDFRQHIKKTLEKAKVVLVVIGPDWFGHGPRRGRRIDDPNDFVRLEVAGALERGIPVIPVLVNNAKMPKAENLPGDITELAFRNGLVLDSGIDFHHHADRLVAGIRAVAEPDTPERKTVEEKKVTAAIPRQSPSFLVGGVILTAAGVAVGAWLLSHHMKKTSERAESNATPNPAQQAINLPGTVVVKTEPPGATVTLGNQTQKSPATFTGIIGNKSSIKIILRGYEPVQRDIAVSDTRGTEVGPIALERAQAVLQINGDSQGQSFQFIDAEGEYHEITAPATINNIPAGYGQIVYQRGGTNQTEAVWVKPHTMTAWNFPDAGRAKPADRAKSPTAQDTKKLFAGTWHGTVHNVITANGATTKSWDSQIELPIDETETRWGNMSNGSVFRRDRTLAYTGVSVGDDGSKQQLHATLMVREDGRTATYTTSVKPLSGGKGQQTFGKGTLEKVP